MSGSTTSDDEGATTAEEVPAASHVGRVAIRVGSLDRVLPFYESAVGLAVTRRDDRAVLGPTSEEPLIVLLEDRNASERPREAAGLFHLAIRTPDRAALGDAVRRLRGRDATLVGASDHLVSEALYLRDPEGNGVELYRDRPRQSWPDTADGLAGLETRPLDLDDLEGAGTGEHVDRFPAGTDVGHVHLEVTDLHRAEAFYREALGLRLRDRYGDSATFLAAGDYHHHVGLNVWNGRSRAAGDHRGLAWWELVLPDVDALQAVIDRCTSRGVEVDDSATVGGVDGRAVRDPDGLTLRLVTAG